MNSFFNNTTVEIYRYHEDNGYDRFGELPGTYELYDTISADIQPMTMNDSLKEFGTVLQDTYKLFLSGDVDVCATDKLKIGADEFTIIGVPENWNHLLNYKQLTIKLERK